MGAGHSYSYSDDGPVPTALPANGLWLAAAYLWAGVGLALAVLALVGWDALADPPVLLVNIAVATVAGGLLLLAHLRTWVVPLQAQYAAAVLGLLLVSVTSYAIGGAEGAVFACSYGFAAAITAMYYPRRVVAAMVTLAAGMYAVVVAVGGGTVAQWLLVMGVATVSGLLAGGYHRRVRRLAARLHGLEQWRSMLMSTLAHDLRSPLGASQSTLDLLLQHGDRIDHARQRDLLEGVRRHQARALHLTRDLLDHERVHAGKLTVDLEPVGLAEVVAAAADDVAADIEVSVPTDLVVVADAGRLEQVLVNLLTNATRYGHGPIEVGARREGDRGHCWVRDHGPGLPEARREHLTGRFAAGDADGSVGLGLWIIDRLLDAQGAELTYEDAGPGARFSWSLPGPVPARSADADRIAADRIAADRIADTTAPHRPLAR